MAYLMMTSGSTSMSYNNNDNKKYKGVKMTKQIKQLKDIKEMDNGKI